jgi:hypothetical protein
VPPVGNTFTKQAAVKRSTFTNKAIKLKPCSVIPGSTPKTNLEAICPVVYLIFQDHDQSTMEISFQHFEVLNQTTLYG